jgi:hypothetical protein
MNDPNVTDIWFHLSTKRGAREAYVVLKNGNEMSCLAYADLNRKRRKSERKKEAGIVTDVASRFYSRFQWKRWLKDPQFQLFVTENLMAQSKSEKKIEWSEDLIGSISTVEGRATALSFLGGYVWRSPSHLRTVLKCSDARWADFRVASKSTYPLDGPPKKRPKKPEALVEKEKKQAAWRAKREAKAKATILASKQTKQGNVPLSSINEN